MIRILQNGITSETILYIVAFLFAILISISVHEFAHAFVAYKNGDNTAKLMGRLSINPLAHLDIFGAICFLLFGFGWAKPVPINPLKFKSYRKGIFLTSIAGIVANIILAFFSGGLYVFMFQFLTLETSQFLTFLITFLTILFSELFIINLGLAIFNLIPIFPLDGFNIIFSLSKGENKFLKFMMKYGSLILLALFITSFFDIALTYLTNMIGMPILSFWEFFIGG